MKNLEIWVITFVIAILLLVGVFYYGILETVVNAWAFIISLVIIFLALILLILFFHREPGKNLTQKQKKVVKKTSSKKSKVIRKK
ncbi:MAG: hypothetical protein AABX80_00200 [Nanoarchaeota archaeon]